jgi:glycosyltransferase involved in cell wall biosynthesis
MHRQGKVATKLPLPLYYAKRFPYKYIFRKAVFNSKKIIVPSKSVKKDLVDYFKVEDEKITVTYEGVDQGLITNRDNASVPSIPMKYKLKGEKYLLYVGNAYPHKNLKRVIEAVKYLNEEKQLNVIFAISSSRNHFIKKLEKETVKQRAEKYVKLLGFVPDRDLVNLYQNSLGYVFPSLAEGFGLPGIEAMNAGTLVLASNISVFREIYENNAFYFNPYDFSSIAKTIENVMKIKAKERMSLILKSQKFISRYSWEKTAKQTLEVYKDALRAA